MAYIEADLAGNRIVAQTEFTERELIKQIPGFTWSTAEKWWHGPLSWGSCQSLRGVFGDRLQIGPVLAGWATQENETRVAPCLSLREQVDGKGDPRLRPFQKPGVEFMARGRQVLLADDMGCGKTPVTVMAVNQLEAWGETVYPVCVICPNAVKIPWADHFASWAQDVDTFVISSNKNKPKTFKAANEAIAAGRRVVIIINWEAVRLHSRLAPFGTVRLKKCVEHGGTDETLKTSACEVHQKDLNLIPFRTVIADEAHKQKDASSKQTRAVWAVQHQAEFRFSLTGTPLANHPGDVWPIMHGVAPLDYPGKTRYVDRYCLTDWSPFGALNIVGVKPETKAEYFRILDPRMRRMSKDLVLKDLPGKTRIKRYAEMNPKQAKAYKEMQEGMLTRVGEYGRLLITTNSMTQHLRLLQFSSSYAEVTDEDKVRLSEPSAKLDVMLEVLAEQGEKPIVIAAESKQLIDLACARLDKAGISWRAVVGGQTDDQRNQSVKDFMDGQARCLLFTIKAGGTGLTLTRADTILFLQRSWSMLENKQAEDRVHRIGSEIHEAILVIDIVAPGTIEEQQILRLHEKAARLEEIVRDREALAKAALTDPDAQTRLHRLEQEEMEIMASDLLPVNGGN